MYSGSLSRIMVVLKLALRKKEIHFHLFLDNFSGQGSVQRESAEANRRIPFLEYLGFMINFPHTICLSQAWTEDEYYQVLALISEE